jgi:hypothetical protein
LKTFLPFRNGVLAVLDSPSYQTKSDANKAFLNKIEFAHLLIFLIDYLVIIVWVEDPWHEPIGNIAKHCSLVQSVQLKKSAERSENIVEKIV